MLAFSNKSAPNQLYLGVKSQEASANDPRAEQLTEVLSVEDPESDLLWLDTDKKWVKHHHVTE